MPYAEGDKVTVVGGKMAGTVVPSKLMKNGSLHLSFNEDVKKADKYAWIFKIDLTEQGCY